MPLRALLLCVWLLPAPFAGAATHLVAATDGALADHLSSARAGDVLRLLPGIHRGPIIVNKALTVDGGGAATIDGRGIGSVISVAAPDVTLTGLTITGSGSHGDGRDAGISLDRAAGGAVVANNRILGNLVGVDIRGAINARVSGNVIEGRSGHRMNARGNGVYIWNAPGAKVIGNDIRWGRDGIFVNTSGNNILSNNRFRDLRFAIHYMYAHNSVVSGNVSLGNHLGYAIMYSKNVRIENNFSRGDRDHGLLMNYTNASRVAGNRIEAVNGKCVFIYNAHKNHLRDNHFEGCGIGIHFTAGSENNEIVNNAFIGNRTQVKYVGSRWLDWSAGGRGNYWSDHMAFDLNGDGIADQPYRPNDLLDHLLWAQPAAKTLLSSPALQLLRWSQSAFPALLPGGVVDRAPLMRPVVPPAFPWKGIR